MPSLRVSPKASGSTCAASAPSPSASLRRAPGAIPRLARRSRSPPVACPHSRQARSFGTRSTAPPKLQARSSTHQASRQHKQTAREEMGTRLFIGNLSYNVTEQELREAFTGEQIELRSVRVALDRETGRPRGFAFVETATDDGAKQSIEKLSGRMIQGRALIIEEAQARPGGPGGGAPPRMGGPPGPPGAPPAPGAPRTFGAVRPPGAPAPGFGPRPPAGGGGFGPARPSGGGSFGPPRAAPGGGFATSPDKPPRGTE